MLTSKSLQTTLSTGLLTAFLSLNILSLAACNLPSPKDKDPSQSSDGSDNSGAATFNVEAMPNRSSVLEATKEGSFALPTSKVFGFYACLKDIYYNKIISGHKFKIDEANQEVTTDDSGCLIWSEKITYNYLADSQYIKIDRHIRGMGLHKGVRTVSYAINPWSHGENLSPVLDVKNQSSIPNLVTSPTASSLALKGYSTDQKIRTRPLWFDDGRLFVTEQRLTSAGVDLLVELRGTPSIQLTKMNGEIFLRPLVSGTFKASLKIIHSYVESGKEIHRLLAQTAFLDVKMENGSLAVRTPLSLPAIPTRGQLVLGLQLQPADGPQGLVGFDGIYILGDYDQIKGNSFLKLSSQVGQDQSFKLDTYINAQLSQVSAATTTDINTGTSPGSYADDTYQKPQIEVTPLEIKNVRIGQETTSSREVIYNIKACVKNGIDQKVTRAQTFKITKFRQNSSDAANTVLVKTDNNACVNWDETLTINYFACQHYLKGFVQIENADLGMSEKLDILINPWDKTGNGGRDLRYVDATEKLSLDCKQENRPQTQIIIDAFSYNTLSYKYQVDNLLNLTVKKNLQIKMEPRLLMYSSLSNGRGEFERLRDGIYLLKLAVVRNRDYDDTNTFVTSAEKIVNVMSGQVNTDITFETQDLKALGNRNNLLAEIYPVDESKVIITANGVSLKQAGAPLDSAIDTNSNLQSPTFAGPFVLNTDEGSRPLKIIDASAVNAFLLSGHGANSSAVKGLISQVVKEGLANKETLFKVAAARTTNVQFASENNLALVNLNAMAPNDLLSKKLNLKKTVKDRFTVNKADLQGLLNTSRISNQTAQKLCLFWMNEFFSNQYAEKGGATYGLPQSDMANDCFRIVSADPSQFFQIEKRLAVKEVGDTQYVKGFNQGLTVGTNFSLSNAHSNSMTKSVSISAKAGLSKKFLDIFSLGADVGGSLSWSSSDSTGNSNTTSVSTSTSMTVQQSLLKVRVNKYEQCVLVNLNPTLFIKDPRWFFGRKNYLANINPRLNPDEKASVATRGLMICEGQVRTQPIDINENFYLVAQESSSTQMQDAGDERNRNFFIALRSTNDFNRFVLAIKGELNAPDSSGRDANMQKDETNLMNKLFKLGAPASPGMFLLR